MSNYFVFTDEAGTYKKYPSSSHIEKNPFYVRSYVLMSIDDYHQYQIDTQRISGEYGIQYDEEIKWSDLWTKSKHPRNQLIANMSEDRLKSYYRRIIETATGKESTVFLFTATDMIGRTCNLDNDTVYKFHLQDAFQRIQMDMNGDDFSTFIMDELNEETIRQIKSACHSITVNGDFVEYKNLYHGVLIENSLYSPGIQLADYAVGVMNGYLRGRIADPGNYRFATDLFNNYIKPRLRHGTNGKVVGYGVVDIPKPTAFRTQLEGIFD